MKTTASTATTLTVAIAGCGNVNDRTTMMFGVGMITGIRGNISWLILDGMDRALQRA